MRLRKEKAATTLCEGAWEAVINSEFVIPAKAGIQEKQQSGHRPAPV
jgi:hypothetical protein